MTASQKRFHPTIETLEERQLMSANSLGEVIPTTLGHIVFPESWLDGTRDANGAIEILHAGENARVTLSGRMPLKFYKPDPKMPANSEPAVYDLQVYFSPDQKVDASDRMVASTWTSPWTDRWERSTGFTTPSATDSIWKNAETWLNHTGDIRYGDYWTNVLMRRRDTGETWWGTPHKEFLVLAENVKPDIRMDSLSIDNGKMYFTYEITGKIKPDVVRLQVVQSKDQVYGNGDDISLKVLTLSNSLLTEGKHVASVTVGSGMQIQVPGAGRPEVDGLYYLIVKADFDEKVGESNGKNNVAVMTNPDIRMEKVWIDNGKIHYTYEVTGWIPKEKVYARFVQSTDSVYSANDTKLDYFYLTGSQLTKGMHTATRTIGMSAGQVRLPGLGLPAATRDFYLVAKVDSGNLLGENLETNNEASTRPDVKITNVRFELSQNTRVVAFDFATRDISKDVVVWLYQSHSETFNKLSATVGAKMTLASTETRGVFKLSQSLNVSNGNYVYVVADPNADLFETSETNNVARGAPDVEVSRISYSGSLAQIAYRYAAWNMSASIGVTLYQSDSATFDRARSKVLAQASVSPKGSTGTFVLPADPVRENGRFLYVEMNQKGLAAESIKTNNVAQLEVPPKGNIKADFLKQIKAHMDNLNKGSGLSANYFSMGNSDQFIRVVDRYLKGVAVDPVFLNNYDSTEGKGSLDGLTVPTSILGRFGAEYNGWIVLRNSSDLRSEAAINAFHEAVHAYHLGVGSDVDEDLAGGTEGVTNFFASALVRMRALDVRIAEVEIRILAGQSYATELEAIRKSFQLQRKLFDERSEHDAILAVLGNMKGKADFDGFQAAFEAKIAAALALGK